MGDFGDAERQILSFMVEGTEFEFEDRKYVVELSENQRVIKESRRQIFMFWQNHH